MKTSIYKGFSIAMFDYYWGMVLFNHQNCRKRVPRTQKYCFFASKLVFHPKNQVFDHQKWWANHEKMQLFIV